MGTGEALQLAGMGIAGFARMAGCFAPVPGLLPAVEIACAIAIMCENVVANKAAARQLSDRCTQLLEVIRDEGTGWPDGQFDEATRQAELLLKVIHKRMSHWGNQKRMTAFLHQQKISNDIQESNAGIDRMCERIQIASHMEIHKWQQQFEFSCKEDLRLIINTLADISKRQDLFSEALAMQQQMPNYGANPMRDVMDMMQSNLSRMEIGDPRHNNLQRNLHYFQQESGDLLPDLELKRGEVHRVGKHAVGGSNAMDIWEGVYLDGEKVAIKMMRAVHSNEKNVNRFKREVAVWSKLWVVDKGKHILPIYGWCQTDGPYPYIVSPWQPNGTAIKYVKQNPVCDHKKLILGIAQGLQVLHSMSPAFIHGDLRGENIQIATDGRPLLADFGLSKMVQDMHGASYTQSKGVSDSCRFTAKELLTGDGAMSTASDIWAFAMTALQLFTGELPYKEKTRNTEVVISCFMDQLPARPSGPEVVRKGLTDGVWILLQRCWRAPEKRPTIDEVILELEYLFSD